MHGALIRPCPVIISKTRPIPEFEVPPQPRFPVQPPSPHHVDGLRVTSKAEGITTGCSPKVDGYNHREGGLLWSSGLWLLQVQDRKSASNQEELPPPLHCLWPKAALSQSQWPTFLVHPPCPPLRPGHATCLDSPKPLR